MSTFNSNNLCFLVLFLFLLGIVFGVAQVIGRESDHSLYTELFYGENE